jgi:hypothetical protein
MGSESMLLRLVSRESYHTLGRCVDTDKIVVDTAEPVTKNYSTEAVGSSLLVHVL